MISRRLFNAGLASTTVLPSLNLGRLASNDAEVGCYGVWAMDFLDIRPENPEPTINMFKVGLYTDKEKTTEKIKYLDFIKKTEKVDFNLKFTKSLFYNIPSRKKWGWALHKDYFKCAGIEYIDIKILDRNTKKPITFNNLDNLLSQRFDIEINTKKMLYSSFYSKDSDSVYAMETFHALEDYKLSCVFMTSDLTF